MIELGLSTDTMTYYYFLGIGGLFAAWGGMYVVQGFKRIVKQNVVPIEDINEIKEFAVDFSSKEEIADSRGYQQQESVSKNIERRLFESTSFEKLTNNSGELKIPSNDAQDEPIDVLKNKLRIVSLENEKLKQALDREIASKDPITLVEEEKKLLERQREDAQSKQFSIDRLSEENLRLSQQLQEIKQKNGVVLDDLTKLKNQYHFLFNQAKLQIRNLRDEFVNLSDESSNNITKAQIEAVEKLRSDKEDLFRTLKQQETQLKEFQDNIDLVKVNYETKLTKLKEENENLEVLLKSQGVMKSIQGEEIKSIVEQLKKDKDSLAKLHIEKEMDCKKLRELNSSLLEKERLLQYELAKNRAQSVGLERVCEDFKVRIESMEEELSKKNELS